MYACCDGPIGARTMLAKLSYSRRPRPSSALRVLRSGWIAISTTTTTSTSAPRMADGGEMRVPAGCWCAEDTGWADGWIWMGMDGYGWIWIDG